MQRSLKRLKTDYLDVVCAYHSFLSLTHLHTHDITDTSDLHDVEFVNSHPCPSPGGAHIAALKALDPSPCTDFDAFEDTFGLKPPYTPRGPGDAQILEGLSALSDLRSQGVVRKIGIAGYPLPTLLRLCLLAQKAGIKIDIVQTYAQQTIINPSLTGGYLASFAQAGVDKVTNAAPLAMGILTTAGGPEWHPTNRERGPSFEACREASALCQEKGTSIEAVSLGFGMKALSTPSGADIPVVIGCKSIQEIKRTVEQWKKVNEGEKSEKEKEIEQEVIEIFKRRGVLGVSWESPSPEAF